MRLAFRTPLGLVTGLLLIGACLMAATIAAAQPSGTDTTPGPAGGDQLVSIDFNNVDLAVFVKFISDLTKKNFIIDEKVRGRVTVISPGRITVAEAYRVFESVLEVNGFTTVPSGAVTKIVPAPEARAKSIKTRIEEEAGRPGDNVITQIVPLRYADPNEIKNLFTPLVSRNSVIQAYPPTNTLIITDVHSNIDRLLQILKAIDITGVGQQIALIPVQNASAAKLVTMLESIFRAAREQGASEKDIVFVADDRTNTLIVLASEGDIDNIRQLVRSLDKEAPRGQGNINVYYLEHASSEDMVKVLQEILQRGGETVDEEGRPVAPVVSSRVRITADKPTNSLIIMADMEEYMVLESIIRKIDIPRSMVYIEALIMEVNVNKDFRLGTEWTIGAETSYKGKDGIYGGGFRGEDPLITYGQGLTAGSVIPSLPSGMSLGIFGEFLEISGFTFPSISAMVQAYSKDRDVRILSTPQILTTDNQEARIYVGKNVPFQTTATASTTGTEIFNSFEYRDVGKSLKITPQISKDRMVRLLISLEVTALEGVATTRPTTLKRTIETTAIVQDGHSVVLGGLIDDNEDAARYKVPCLGDIPGFGALFSSRASNFEKSNLYVFLTPRVIQDNEEAARVSRNKRQQIEGSLEENIKLYNSDQNMPPAETLQIPGPRSAAPAETSGTVAADREVTSDTSARNANISADETSRANPADNADTVPTTAVEQSSRSANSTVEGFTLQVASVQNREQAGKLLDTLIAEGHAAYIVRSEIEGETWYRLRIGYFATPKDAEATIRQLRASRHDPILIKL